MNKLATLSLGLTLLTTGCLQPGPTDVTEESVGIPFGGTYVQCGQTLPYFPMDLGNWNGTPFWTSGAIVIATYPIPNSLSLEVYGVAFDDPANPRIDFLVYGTADQVTSLMRAFPEDFLFKGVPGGLAQAAAPTPKTKPKPKLKPCGWAGDVLDDAKDSYYEIIGQTPPPVPSSAPDPGNLGGGGGGGGGGTATGGSGGKVTKHVLE